MKKMLQIFVKKNERNFKIKEKNGDEFQNFYCSHISSFVTIDLFFLRKVGKKLFHPNLAQKNGKFTSSAFFSHIQSFTTIFLFLWNENYLIAELNFSIRLALKPCLKTASKA